VGKYCYRERNFKPDSLVLIVRINAIIAKYRAQNLRLTLRQAYYQLVSANVISNTEKSYKNLGSLISDGRLAGLIDWDAIEDRVRRPKVQSDWESVADLVDSAVAAYRLPRWEGQRYYAELWVEKDALAGVLEPMAREFHVTMMVNRGYSSQSAMYEAGRRFRDAEREGKELVLFYLGDHDPSGEDMVRDVRDRLSMFEVRDLDVQKLALTMTQIEEYDPPPNPAKMSDSRAAKYVAEHGASSWEVDALPPDVLQQIIRDSFENIIDHDLVDEIKEREESDKKRLRTAAAKIAKS